MHVLIVIYCFNRGKFENPTAHREGERTDGAGSPKAFFAVNQR